MPKEVVIIVVVAIIAGTISSIMKHIFSYAKARVREQPREGSSLTTSELQRMLQAAVAEGNARLEERFDLLEARLARLEKAESPAALEVHAGQRIDSRLLEETPETPEPAPVSRRVHSS